MGNSITGDPVPEIFRRRHSVAEEDVTGYPNLTFSAVMQQRAKDFVDETIESTLGIFHPTVRGWAETFLAMEIWLNDPVLYLVFTGDNTMWDWFLTPDDPMELYWDFVENPDGAVDALRLMMYSICFEMAKAYTERPELGHFEIEQRARVCLGWPKECSDGNGWYISIPEDLQVLDRFGHFTDRTELVEHIMTTYERPEIWGL